MKKIKAVEIVRKIRDRQYLLTKNMSDKELIAYFRQKAKDVNDEIIKSLKTKHKIA